MTGSMVKVSHGSGSVAGRHSPILILTGSGRRHIVADQVGTHAVLSGLYRGHPLEAKGIAAVASRREEDLRASALPHRPVEKPTPECDQPLGGRAVDHHPSQLCTNGFLLWRSW
jgi:hypothetical protein